ncbi:holin [Lactiplantibacillus plantarum]|uniref:hemolysin XhlA family protein n=1 Tax=Lactiplantibacillus plantarum TaxID=1590 RepID=UPI001058AD11|nr:hemolysin XhlA family protein [Lactiplantibacillus plantarum]MDP5371025.1 hemolysin XhlA family protein [Lactiplantibacillus plantarum]QIA84729.1 holin [Lactiplantibacillus plantarum]QVG77573.1 hemolysin XhlA family protein [Lactiplantibacillus plantarum]TDH41973.1 holin [Lactiplantibacillus plantarum]
MTQLDDTTKLLMSIQKDVAATKTKVDNIEAKLKQVDLTDQKAEKALTKSVETEHRMDRITMIQNWVIGVLFSGVVVTLLVYVAEKFL